MLHVVLGLASLLVVCFVASLGSAEVGAEREPPLLPELPISVSVANLDGKSVVEDQWIEQQILWANHLFWPYGVSFKVVERRALEESHARLESRHDRHDLGGEMVESKINWFVVHSLRDVDEPSRFRQGVHWRPQGYPGKHFVIVSSIAGPSVLAHELGHFFGNRRHSKVPGNIMSYSRGDDPPFFDAVQVGIIHRSVKGFIETGELVPQ